VSDMWPAPMTDAEREKEGKKIMARIRRAEKLEAEELGKIVRQAWVDYCKETGRTDDPQKICGWKELDEWSKEVDRRIGVAVARHAREGYYEMSWRESVGLA
jgi:hypothetical protein